MFGSSVPVKQSLIAVSPSRRTARGAACRALRYWLTEPAHAAGVDVGPFEPHPAASAARRASKARIGRRRSTADHARDAGHAGEWPGACQNQAPMPFRPVDPKQSFPELEERILERWRERDVFHRSVAQREGGEV